MNIELMSSTSECIAQLREKLVSVMASAPATKEPIILQILQKVVLLRDLSQARP